ncbi:MAG: hypothetical protein SCK28_14635 [Bacillota bacterium]|nr:hypothetical protein [Bacillota bacterium]
MKFIRKLIILALLLFVGVGLAGANKMELQSSGINLKDSYVAYNHDNQIGEVTENDQENKEYLANQQNHERQSESPEQWLVALQEEITIELEQVERKHSESSRHQQAPNQSRWEPTWVSNNRANEKLNQETENLNVLFIGVGDGELKMVSLYSIDHEDTWGSAAIFFPTVTTVAEGTSPLLLKDIYKQKGVDGIVLALEDKLEVAINYHIRVDREVLTKVAEIIDPIYVEGEEVDIHNLFDMEVSEHDDYILGQLVSQFRKPSVFFFSLPELFFSFRRHISTDFAITPSNLYLHYRVARNIEIEQLTKTIVSGWDYYYQGETVRIIPEDTWKNVVYRLTKGGNRIE